MSIYRQAVWVVIVLFAGGGQAASAAPVLLPDAFGSFNYEDQSYPVTDFPAGASSGCGSLAK